MGSRLPSAYTCSSSTAVSTPNLPATYYSPLHPDIASSLKQGALPPPISASTTKPYAIVNAIPMPSSGSSILVHPNPGGEPSGQQFMQVFYDGNGMSRLVPVNSQGACVVSLGSTSGATPPLPHSASTETEKEEYLRKKIIDEDLKSIQKQIGDAFNSSSVSMLVSAFNDALVKFEANSTSYKSQLAKKKALSLGNSTHSVEGASQVQAMPPRHCVLVPKPPLLTPLSPPHGDRAGMANPRSKQQQQQQQLHQLLPHQQHLQQQFQQQQLLQKLQQQRQQQLQKLNKKQEQQHAVQTFTFRSVCPNLYKTTPASKTAHPATSTSNLVQPIQSEQNGVATKTKTPSTNVGSTKSIAADHQPGVSPRQGIVAPTVRSSIHGSHRKLLQQMDSRSKKSSKPASLTSIDERKKTTNDICASCGKSANFLCSGCERVWYCSKICQVGSRLYCYG